MYAADAERRCRSRLLLHILVIDGKPFVAKKPRKAASQRTVECEVAFVNTHEKVKAKFFCLFGVNMTSSREDHVSIDLLPGDAQ
jgi:hypothetical protein